jgi:hypothetical protein
MFSFTSDREQRLWFWVLVVMVAIYSTLGPAQLIAQELRERNLLRVSFAVVLILAGTVVVWQRMKKRPGWREFGVAFGVTFAYLWTLLRAFSPEERTHLIEYAVVAAFIHQALAERVRHGDRIPVPAVLTVVATALLGWID